MRDTDTAIDMLDDIVFKECKKQFFPGCDESASAPSVNVKTGSSDVGFPINVYGTIIARDMLDRKCVCLFRCNRDHIHLILTKVCTSSMGAAWFYMHTFDSQIAFTFWRVISHFSF